MSDTSNVPQDRRERMARVRQHRRPMTTPEAAAMARRANLKRALTRLRPVYWPRGPLSTAQVAFALDVTRSAVAVAIKEGRLPAVRVGRAYKVQQADVQAFMAAQIRQAQSLGISVPETALYVAGLRRRFPAEWDLVLEA